jgi:hypothetical protein
VKEQGVGFRGRRGLGFRGQVGIGFKVSGVGASPGAGCSWDAVEGRVRV